MSEEFAEVVTHPGSINEFAIVGEFGFARVDGPFTVDKEEGKWTIFVPTDVEDGGQRLLRRNLTDLEGESTALLADGEIVGGGIAEAIRQPGDEDELHVVVTQGGLD